MRLLGMSTVAAIALALGLVACTVPPEQRARDVATAYCNCVEVGHSAVDKCIEMLIPQIPDVSDECLTCVYENSNSCSNLLDDCTTFCSPQQPQP